MKKLLLFFFWIITIQYTFAQTLYVENTPCTAICLDVSKNTIKGRNPNYDGYAPNKYLPCGKGSGTTEHNPLWFIFKPKTDSIVFILRASNCIGPSSDLGLQITIWEGDNCEDLTPLKCYSGFTGVVSTKLQANKVYYLQIDGIDESQCDFVLDFNKSMFHSTFTDAPVIKTKACTNSTIQYSVAELPDTPANYEWSVSPSNLATITSSTNTQTVDVKFVNQVGKVKLICKQTYTGLCAGMGQKQVYDIDIQADSVLELTKCRYQICEKEQPFVVDLRECFKKGVSPDFATHTVSNISKGKDSLIYRTTYLDKKRGCKLLDALIVEVVPSAPILLTLPPILLCQGDTVKIKNRYFTCADASLEPIRFTQKGIATMCDTTFEVVVQCITVNAICYPSFTIFDCIKQSNELDLSKSTFYPNDLITANFTGIGTKEYIFSINKDTLTSKYTLKTPKDIYASVKYTYKLNHKGAVSQKTCSSYQNIPRYFRDSITSNKQGFIIEATPPCQQKIFTARIINPDDLTKMFYAWDCNTNTSPLTKKFGASSFMFSRNDDNLPAVIYLKRAVCNQAISEVVARAVEPLSPINVEIRGKKLLCENEIGAYRVDRLQNGINYKWTVVNGNIITMLDSSSVLVAWDASKQAGKITLELSNSCGIISKKDYDVAFLSNCKKCLANAGQLATKNIITSKITKPITYKNKSNTLAFGFDDTYAYVLHEGKLDKIVNPIATNQTGIFNFIPATMKCNRIYYISYIVGKKNNGLPDINDKCLSITPKGQAVSWLCGIKPPTALKPNTEGDIAFNTEQLLGFSIFPNPATETLNITIFAETIQNFDFQLFNLQGVLLKNQKLDSSQQAIDINDLANGMYLVEILENGKSLKKEKIVVLR